MNIPQNLNTVNLRIKTACEKTGRSPDSVKLIVVTKTHPAELVQEAVDAGAVDLGENRVQELLQKHPQIRGNVQWHLIGHLQTNKVKKIIDKVRLIHSVDSLRLAEEIQRCAANHDINVNILIQVNTSQEESKFGCEPEEAMELTKQVSLLKNLRINGLMTIGRFVDDAERVRPCFKILRETAEAVRKEGISEVPELSMGMTNDFETAIEEGSTMVRVGSAIFGERQ